jgi:hypothetical protein
MGLEARQLEFSGGGVVADLTISEASIGQTIRKGVLAIRANSTNPNSTEASVEEFTYMNCLAVAKGEITYVEVAPEKFRPEGYDLEDPEPVTVSVHDLEIGDFLALPGGLGNEWVRLVYALNPSWRAGSTRPETELGETKGDGE